MGDREIFLVGTAHVSRESVEDVRKTIEAVRPDSVCVELDEGRYQNLTDLGRWKRTNISQVIRKGKAMLLLSSLIMTAFQRKIGKKLGVMPGAELLEGVKAAEDVGAQLVLADRDIQITLKRTWGNFGLIERIKVVGQLMASLFVTEEVDEKMVEELKNQEKLGDVLDMRHVQGIERSLTTDHDLTPLESVPRPSITGRILKWAIPGLILALFVYAFLTGGAERSIDSIYIWFLVNGILSALGAAVALGHPITILSAFLAAPLTSLNPMIAAGWVSGLVQAIVKKPTVQDLEDLPEAINSVRGFWSNPVSRILLVVVFSNLGSMLGTFLAGSWIAARLFG
ncbi:MAG: TraB/GumN family protein [Acidobacteriota bacterium]